VKGKGRDKETEVVNLEDVIDVKGWKAMGNRLSQFKVTKVKPVEEPEDSGLEEGDDENEVQMTEAKDSPSSKKKIWESEAEEGEQSSLFEAEHPKESSFAKASEDKQTLVNGQPPKAKEEKPKEAKQSSLFGEKEKSDEEKIGKDEEGFTPGQTIELDL
jgi:topoisomerase-4 subunit A